MDGRTEGRTSGQVEKNYAYGQCRLATGAVPRGHGAAAPSESSAPMAPMKFMIRHINCHLPDWEARLITVYSLALS